MSNKQLFLDTYKYVLDEINPRHLVKRFCEKFDFKGHENIYVVGAGKGASRMAEAIEARIGEWITQGLVIIPEEEKEPELNKIEYVFGSHPFPNENSVEGARKILDMVNNAQEGDLIIALISGGGSSLMSLPVDDITLDEKIATSELLIKNSIRIQDINIVRKHISQVKGGFLAKAAFPCPVLQLVISDVVGDDLSTIASGPFHPDPTTFADAIQVLKKHEIYDKVPQSVRTYLEKGEPETPKRIEKVETHILANHETAALKAFKYLEKQGIKAKILSTSLEGDCNKQAIDLIARIEPSETIHIMAGETTVKVKGHGYGGRNQQFVLACLNELTQDRDFTIAAIGTDGIDGICPEKIAGAIATADTLKAAKEKEMYISHYLERNNSFTFFKETGGLIKTGPTGTNLGDLILFSLN